MSGIVNIALLRGINVGKAKRIAMADLRRVVLDLGYTDVSTLLNSGNVVFTVPRGAKGVAAKRIESAIAKELGVRARVTVLRKLQLDVAIDENPYMLEAAENASRLLVAVFATPKDRSKAAALRDERGRPKFGLGRFAAYLWCPDGILASADAAEFGKRMKDGVTTRNWATMLKLQLLAMRSE